MPNKCRNRRSKGARKGPTPEAMNDTWNKMCDILELGKGCSEVELGVQSSALTFSGLSTSITAEVKALLPSTSSWLAGGGDILNHEETEHVQISSTWPYDLDTWPCFWNGGFVQSSFGESADGNAEANKTHETSFEFSQSANDTSIVNYDDNTFHEISGTEVLRTVFGSEDLRIPLRIRFCPDEPFILEETDACSESHVLRQRWQAASLSPKWSALSPLLASDARCYGSVMKNTFVHIAPPSVIVREHTAQSRSKSIPKDFGSVRSVWRSACHAFKLCTDSCVTDAGRAQLDDAVTSITTLLVDSATDVNAGQNQQVSRNASRRPERRDHTSLCGKKLLSGEGIL